MAQVLARKCTCQNLFIEITMCFKNQPRQSRITSQDLQYLRRSSIILCWQVIKYFKKILKSLTTHRFVKQTYTLIRLKNNCLKEDCLP